MGKDFTENKKVQDIYSDFVHLSRYARYIPEENRRETWEETVQRYFDFFEPRVPESLLEEFKEAQGYVLRKEVMPSMRCLMTAGRALERDNVASFNCAYSPVESLRDFDEAMYILMCGTGQGFSVERQYVTQKLPAVPEELFETDTCIEVADSKIGWAKAFRELLALLFAGQIPKWDLSKVRPAGERLRTFGGRASGPAPLEDLFRFSVALVRGAAGRKLTSLECHDLMCKVAQIVVVGGVRRSAMISLSNLSDRRMASAKEGEFFNKNPQRTLSNNSVAYTERPDFQSFLEEWNTLYHSKSGERGIFNRQASENKVLSLPNREPGHEWGCNPCFSYHTRILTAHGYKEIGDLAEREFFTIVNKDGECVPSRAWKSGTKETVSLQWEKALEKDPLICTPDHVFMLTDGSECEAKDLKGKQIMPFIQERASALGSNAALAGFILGDGILTDLADETKKGIAVCLNKDKDKEIIEFYNLELKEGQSQWYSKTAADVARKFRLPAKRIGERGLPRSLLSEEALQGLYSANGSVIKKGRVALKTTDYEQAQEVKAYLLSLGIRSYITTNKPRKVEFSNGEYLCKQSYDVNIAQYQSLLTFCARVNFFQEYKRKALKEVLLKKAPVVKTVRPAEKQDVFDFTEPRTHWGVVEGFIAHNCSEIILRPHEFCNLSEVVVRPEDTTETLQSKIRVATLLGTLQSTLTDFRYLRSVWKKNTEEERLLGVSLTGIMDHALLSNPDLKALPRVLRDLRDHARLSNAYFADELGIPHSAAITCVKPSGTVSQLVNSASGIHARYARTYIRRVRADKKDPLAQWMASKGVPVEDDLFNPDVQVFSFPIKAPEDAVVEQDLDALRALRLWKIYQDEYCDHKPSCTVHYKDSEFLAVGQWVWDNFDSISGISFLPVDDHVYQQAPYERITEEEYTALTDSMPSVDFSEYIEYDDNTTGSQEFACSADGACEIVDLT